MANPIFRNRLISRIEGAIAEAREASQLEHNLLAGRVREIAVERLFRPLLSPDFEIGTGKITDCRGELSNETDVIIYSPKLIPPILFDRTFGIFPIESCLTTIEVKTTLTATELKSTIASARRLKTGLKFTFGKYEDGQSVVHEMKRETRALFAFGTDLGVKAELDRYKENDEAWATAPLLNAICVVGVGTWLFDQVTRTWLSIKATPDHDEVVEFLANCAWHLPGVLLSRGQPQVAVYLSNQVTLSPVVPPGPTI